MARHVRQGDLVQVISGNDRGRTGRILKVITKSDQVIVEGINRRFRHVKPTQKNPQGGRIEKEMPIHISNVQPVSPSANKPTRVRFALKADGTKVRVAVRGGDELSTLKKAK